MVYLRWNMEEIDDILEEGTIRVTSIREPLSCFRSVYNYFYSRIKVRLGVVNENSCPAFECYHTRPLCSSYKYLNRIMIIDHRQLY